MATKSSTTKFSTSTKSTSSKNTNTVANLNNLIQQTVTSVINQQTANTKSLATATKDSTSKNILVNNTTYTTVKIPTGNSVAATVQIPNIVKDKVAKTDFTVKIKDTNEFVVNPTTTKTEQNTKEERIKTLLDDKIKEINDKINKQVPVVNINEDVVEVKVEEKTTVESDAEYDEFTFVPKRITPYNFDSSLVQAIMIDDLDTPDINMSLRYHDYLKRNKNFNCAHDFFSFFEVKNITGNKIDIIKDKLKNIQLYENLISNYETQLLNTIYTKPIVSVKSLDTTYPDILVDWNKNDENNKWGTVSTDITVRNSYIYISSIEDIENPNINIFWKDNYLPNFTVNFDGSILLNNSSKYFANSTTKNNKVTFESSADTSCFSEIYSYNLAYNINVFNGFTDYATTKNEVNVSSVLVPNPINNYIRFNDDANVLLSYVTIDKTSNTIESSIHFIPDKNDYPLSGGLTATVFLCSDITDTTAFNALTLSDKEETIEDNSFYAVKFKQSTARNKFPKVSINKSTNTLTLKLTCQNKGDDIRKALLYYFEKELKTVPNYETFKSKLCPENVAKINSNVGFIIKLTNSNKDNEILSQSYIKLKLIENTLSNTDYGVKYKVTIKKHLYKKGENPFLSANNLPEDKTQIETSVLKYYVIELFGGKLEKNNYFSANVGIPTIYATPSGVIGVPYKIDEDIDNKLLIYSATPSEKNGKEKPKIKLSGDRTQLYVLPYGTDAYSYISIYGVNNVTGEIVKNELKLKNFYTESLNSSVSTIDKINFDATTTSEESSDETAIKFEKIFMHQQYASEFYLPIYIKAQFDQNPVNEEDLELLNSACVKSITFNNFDNFENFAFGSLEIVLNKKLFYSLYTNHFYDSVYNLPVVITTIRDNDILENKIILQLTNIKNSEDTIKNSIVKIDENNEYKFEEEVENGWFKYTNNENVIYVKDNVYKIGNNANDKKIKYVTGINDNNDKDAEITFKQSNNTRSLAEPSQPEEQNVNESNSITDAYELTTLMYKPLKNKKFDRINTSFTIQLFKNDKQIDLSVKPEISNSLFPNPTNRDNWIMNIDRLDANETKSNKIEYKVVFTTNPSVGELAGEKNIDFKISNICGYDITLNVDIEKKNVISDPYESFNITDLSSNSPDLITNYYAFKINSITGFINGEYFLAKFDYNNIILYGLNTKYSVKLVFGYETIDELDEEYLVRIPESFKMPIKYNEEPIDETTDLKIGEKQINLVFDIQYDLNAKFGKFKMPFLQELMDKWKPIKSAKNATPIKKFFAFNSGEHLIEIKDETSAAEIYNALAKENISDISNIRFYEGRLIPKVRTKYDFIKSLNSNISLNYEIGAQLTELTNDVQRQVFPLTKLTQVEIAGKETEKPKYKYEFTPSNEAIKIDIDNNTKVDVSVDKLDRKKIAKIQTTLTNIVYRKIDPELIKIEEETDFDTQQSEIMIVTEEDNKQKPTIKRRPVYTVQQKLTTLSGIKEVVNDLTDDEFDELVNEIERDEDAKVGNPLINIFFTRNTGGLDIETINYIQSLTIKSLDDFGKILEKQTIPNKLQKMWNNDWFYNKPTNVFGSEMRWNSSYSIGLMNDKFLMWDLNTKNDSTEKFNIIRTLSFPIEHTSSSVKVPEEYKYTAIYPYYNIVDNSKVYLGSMLNNIFFDYLSNVFTYDYSSHTIDIKDITPKYRMRFFGDEINEHTFNQIINNFNSKNQLIFNYKIYNKLLAEGDSINLYLGDKFNNLTLSYSSVCSAIDYWENHKDEITYIYEENLQKYDEISNNLLMFNGVDEKVLKQDLYEYSKYLFSKFDPLNQKFEKEYKDEIKNKFKETINEKLVDKKITPNNNIDKRKTFLNDIAKEFFDGEGQLKFFPHVNSYIYNIISENGIFNYPDEIITSSKYDLVANNKIEKTENETGDFYDYIYDDDHKYIIGITKDYDFKKSLLNDITYISDEDVKYTYYIGDFSYSYNYTYIDENGESQTGIYEGVSKNAYICKIGEVPTWQEKTSSYSALRISPTGNVIKYNYDASYIYEYNTTTKAYDCVGNNLSKYENRYNYNSKNDVKFIKISLTENKNTFYINNTKTSYEVGSIKIGNYDFKNCFIYDARKKLNISYDGYGEPLSFNAYKLEETGKITPHLFKREDFLKGIYANNLYSEEELTLDVSFIQYPCNTNSLEYFFKNDEDRYFINKYEDTNKEIKSYLYKIEQNIDLQKYIDVHTHCINLHLLNLERNADIISVLDNMNEINKAITSETSYTYNLITCYTNSYVLYDKRTYFDAEGNFGQYDVTYVDVNLEYTYVDKFNGFTYIGDNEVLRVNIPKNTYIIPLYKITANKKAENQNVIYMDTEELNNVNITYNEVLNTSINSNCTNTNSYIYTYLWNNSCIDFEFKLPILKQNNNTEITCTYEYYVSSEKDYHPYTYTITPRIWINATKEYEYLSGGIGTRRYEFGINLVNAPCGKVPWSYVYNEDHISVSSISTYTDIQDFKTLSTNGINNTRNILNQVNSKILVDAPAFRHAKSYLMDNGNNNISYQIFDFYLGDATEWQIVADNVELINTYLTYLGGETLYDGTFETDLPEKKWFWTSTENDEDHAWTSSLTSVSLKNVNKNANYFVRPFFKLTDKTHSDYKTFIFNSLESNKNWNITKPNYVPDQEINIFDGGKKETDVATIKEITPIYVALFIFGLNRKSFESDPYFAKPDENNQIWGLGNIRSYYKNIDEFIDFYKNISLFDSVELINYEDLFYSIDDSDKTAHRKNKILHKISKTFVNDTDKLDLHFVVIPIYIYNSLSTVVVDNKYRYISSTNMFDSDKNELNKISSQKVKALLDKHNLVLDETIFKIVIDKGYRFKANTEHLNGTNSLDILQNIFTKIESNDNKETNNTISKDLLPSITTYAIKISNVNYYGGNKEFDINKYRYQQLNIKKVEQIVT